MRKSEHCSISCSKSCSISCSIFPYHVPYHVPYRVPDHNIVPSCILNILNPSFLDSEHEMLLRGHVEGATIHCTMQRLWLFTCLFIAAKNLVTIFISLFSWGLYHCESLFKGYHHRFRHKIFGMEIQRFEVRNYRQKSLMGSSFPATRVVHD